MSDSAQILIVNQETTICSHSKDVVELELIDDAEQLGIYCRKCNMIWSLDGYE